MNDSRLRPEYYAGKGKEPIQIMMEIMSTDEMKGFLEGNVLKYVSRAGKKPGAPAHVDYEKALTYLKWLIQLELFGTIDTERTPKKQEIEPGIDL